MRFLSLEEFSSIKLLVSDLLALMSDILSLKSLKLLFIYFWAFKFSMSASLIRKLSLLFRSADMHEKLEGIKSGLWEWLQHI